MVNLMIYTTHLELRPFAESDLDAIHQLWIDVEIRRYIFDGKIIARDFVAEEIAASMARFTEDGTGLWSVAQRGIEAMIGFCGYRHFHEPPELELLYGISPAYWGRGLATEATRAMIRYGFEQIGLDLVKASADAPNTASFRVMEKAGLQFEKRIMAGGLDTIYYALQRKDFQPDDSYYQLTQR
ncbi:MAG: GNAT family N-acetyltransferase [Acidobacteriota bacterium]